MFHVKQELGSPSHLRRTTKLGDPGRPGHGRRGRRGVSSATPLHPIGHSRSRTRASCTASGTRPAVSPRHQPPPSAPADHALHKARHSAPPRQAFVGSSIAQARPSRSVQTCVIPRTSSCRVGQGPGTPASLRGESQRISLAVLATCQIWADMRTPATPELSRNRIGRTGRAPPSRLVDFA